MARNRKHTMHHASLPLLLWFYLSSFLDIATASDNVSKITFPATKNMNLDPLPLDPFNEDDFHDIEVIVNSTQLFNSIFSPGEVGYGLPPTDFVPEIEMIRGSEINEVAKIRPSPFGFVGTVAEAYSKHHNLSIRPDDIWQAIISQFSFYVLAREDELRDKFVDFEGKKNLELLFDGSMGDFQDWDKVPPLFLSLLDENMKILDMREWYLPDFSTTTETDIVGAAAAAMCTFQNYFTYSVGFICGIPQISLLGTVDDWKELRSRIERLDEFDDGTGILTEKWVPTLRQILDEFVVSAESGSKTNLDFWDQIMHSATFPYMGEKLSGWILAFTFFNMDGQQIAEDKDNTQVLVPLGEKEGDPFYLPWGIIDAGNVNSNVLSCNIQITDSDEQKYNSTLFVGQMAFDYKPDTAASQNNPNLNPDAMDEVLLISPRTDWSLVVHKNTGLVEMARPYYVDMPKMPQICKEGRLDPECTSEFSECFQSDSLLDPSTIPNPIREEPLPDEALNIFCFSENSFVVEKNRGLIRIKNLRIGDLVQAGKGEFSRIYSFGHRNENSFGDFLQIRYTNADKTSSFIEISPNHLMDVNGSMLPASSVKVGDLLQGNDKGGMIVSKIRNIRRRGVYAPFTESGTILVNNVLASSYVTLQPGIGTLQIASIDTGLSLHELSHLFQGFHRVSCKLYWRWCANESYTEEGISTWVSYNRVIFTRLLKNTELSLALILISVLIAITRSVKKRKC